MGPGKLFLMKTKNEQLELTIESICGASLPQSKIKNRSSKISTWWFARMRQLVDSARDWPESPESRSTPKLLNS